VAGPGAGAEPGEALLDGVVVEVDALAVDVEGVGVCDALGVDPPHPTTTSITKRVTWRACTR